MYRKSFYVFEQSGRPVQAVIRNYQEQDFEGLIDVQRESFPPPFPSELWWNEEQLRSHVTLFPDGAMCCEVDGKIVGSITSLLVNFDPQDPDHSWAEITDDGYIRNHNPQGNTLYIVDISVRPSHRKLGLGKWLMNSMYDLVLHKKLARVLGGGRIPGYHRVADQMTAEEYVNHVMEGKLADPVMTFLLRSGRTPIRVVPNYLEDRESLNYAVLLEWKNPFFN